MAQQSRADRDGHRCVVRALARRELTGRLPPGGVEITRRRWRVDQVLAPEDCAVLLGFSRDGNFMLFYSSSESDFDVMWRAIMSPMSDEAIRISRSPVMRCTVEHSSAPLFGGSSVATARLRVWQSTDDGAVVCISDGHPGSQESSVTYHITVSPSPSRVCSEGVGRASSLRFSHTVPLPAQDLEPWQFVDVGNQRYLLIVNLGASVRVHTFIVCRGEPVVAQTDASLHKDWYHRPEFATDFATACHVTDARPSNCLNVVCSEEMVFDVESFLAHFLNTYRQFHEFHFIDYDVRLVEFVRSEQSLLMICNADLQSSRSPHPGTTRSIIRLALMFSLELRTGATHIIRALRVPNNPALRFSSIAVAKKLWQDVAHVRVREEHATEWSNDAVLNGCSLSVIHNRRYPISIHWK